jgi:putative IMPACT (imprinted ancient) family translation regulator
MAILEKPKQNGITIDLTGPQGNAFYLLGTANNLAKQLGLNGKEIMEEMKSSDYENLINVFDNYFGSIVTLYR